MNGKFAVVLAPHAPPELKLWANSDGYLRCSVLEESLCGMVRVKVEPQENSQQPAATLLIHAAHIAFVLEGLQPKPIGFAPGAAGFQREVS